MADFIRAHVGPAAKIYWNDGCRVFYDGHTDPCASGAGGHNPGSCFTNESKVPHSLLCENTIRELPLNAANKRKDVFLHVETSRCVRVQVPASVDWVSCDTYEDPTVKKSPWPWDPSSSYSAIYNCGRNHAVYPWFLGLSCASMLTGAGSIPEAVAVKYVLQGKISPSVYLPLGLTYGEFAIFPGVGT